jgi:hypothetical protein
VPAGDAPRTVWRQRSDDLSWKEIDSEVIVLDLRSANYLRLNATGSLLWTRLGGGAGAAELAETLVATFGVDAGRANDDVDGFIARCSSLGLIEPVEP